LNDFCVVVGGTIMERKEVEEESFSPFYDNTFRKIWQEQNLTDEKKGFSAGALHIYVVTGQIQKNMYCMRFRKLQTH
jgi:hypothetical protein